MGDDRNNNILNDNLNQLRINDLTNELYQIYEEERSSQNQILSTITAAGTVLGILCGVSVFSEDIDKVIWKTDGTEPGWIIKIASSITTTRAFFWLACLVFIAAFAYITTIGIQSILRYYYLQDLHDRLHYYMKDTYDLLDNDNRGKFLHFREYIAPIKTLKLSHIKSTHTAFHFIFYIITVASSILFSIAMIVVQYARISPKIYIDKVVLFFTGIVICFSFYMFIRMGIAGKASAQFAWDMGHFNLKCREEKRYKELYNGRFDQFYTRLNYFLLPRKKDAYKMLLFPGGFVLGCILFPADICLRLYFDGFIMYFLIELVAYQARYQVNDLRGIDEDAESLHRVPLFKSSDNKYNKHNIRVSLQVLGFRIGISIIALIVSAISGWRLNYWYIGSVSIIVISAFGYEVAKKKGNNRLIFILVGIGYPLRIIAGMGTAFPLLFTYVPRKFMIGFVIAIWAYGSMAVALSWANEVSDIIVKIVHDHGDIDTKSFNKPNYNYMKKRLCGKTISRNASMNQAMYRDRVENRIKREDSRVLLSRGVLGDPWVICGLLSVGIIVLAELQLYRAERLYMLISCFLVAVSLFFKDRAVAVFLASGFLLNVCSIVRSVICWDTSVSDISGILLNLFMVLFIMTLFVLRYRITLPKTVKLKCIQKKIMEHMLGSDLYKILYGSKNE